MTFLGLSTFFLAAHRISSIFCTSNNRTCLIRTSFIAPNNQTEEKKKTFAIIWSELTFNEITTSPTKKKQIVERLREDESTKSTNKLSSYLHFFFGIFDCKGIWLVFFPLIICDRSGWQKATTKKRNRLNCGEWERIAHVRSINVQC